MDDTSAAPPGTHVAVINRVSDPRRGRGASTEDQQAENFAACEQRQWTVTPEATFTEKQSASRFATRARAEWERLVAGVRDKQYGVVVMWESSRADRTPDTWFPFLTACRETGTLIYVTPQDRLYDMRDWRDYRTMAEDGVDAAIEVEKLSDRIKRGVRSTVAGGRPHGRIPYGYERIYDEKTRRLIEQRPHPEQAAVVREIIARAGSCEPVSVITDDLNARRVPAPAGGKWHRDTVRALAVSPTYAAKRYWRGDGQLHDGAWEALVKPEEHAAAVLVLTNPVRAVTRPGRGIHLLSYIAACECGKPLSFRPPGKGEALPGYRCEDGCAATRAPWLDVYVEQLVKRKMSQSGFYEQISGGDDGGAGRDAARAGLEVLEARIARARESYAAGRIEIEDLEAVRLRAAPELEKARKKLAAVSVPPPLRSFASPGEDWEERWQAAPMAARREAVRWLFSEIVLLKASRPGNTRGLDTSRVRWNWREELR